jgi:prepilin-type processing-associated H-X9-DG protein
MANDSFLQLLRCRLALQRETPCGWDELFRNGTADCVPCGKTRGTVLYADGHCPKLKAHLQGTIWRGKNFHGDGTFTNRWLGFQAISANIESGTSWFDGQPCFVMQYPVDTPVFGGVRDEIRLIAPNTWLGRCYDSATGTPKGYFLLQR